MIVASRLLSVPVIRSSVPGLRGTLRTLQAIKLFSIQSTLMEATPSLIKPPNILVYHPSKDATNKEFVRTKESLETCLTPDRYVVYTLGVDDVTESAPWKDNCRLVVVPSNLSEPSGAGTGGVIPAAVLRELVSYVKDGGMLISFHSSVNGVFGSCSAGPQSTVSKESTNSSMYSVQVVSERVGVSCKSPVSPDSGVGDGNDSEELLMFHAHSVPLLESHNEPSATSQDSLNGRPVLIQSQPSSPDSIDVNSLITSRETLAHIQPAVPEWIETNTNQSNNKQVPTSNPETTVATPQTELVSPDTSDIQSVPGVEKVVFKSGGCAVLSRVDLLPLPPADVEVPLLVKLKKDVEARVRFLTSVLSELSLECSEEMVPGLTHTYLVCSREAQSNFVSTCTPLLTPPTHSLVPGRELSVRLLRTDFEAGTPVDEPTKPTHSEQVIITNPARWQLDNQPFDFLEYFESLRTDKLGRTLLYTSVITSTQTLFTGNIEFCNSLRAEMGVVNVAGQQTQGKGRSGNVWISPKGSMMFSTALKFPPTSHLSQRVTLLQHLVAMAVVHGIRTTPGYEDVPIQIKWPNDIYYKNQVKLGGILVTSYTLPSACNLTAVVGCGVNIGNRYPTMSVNDCIALHNAATGASLLPLSVEHCLAHTLNSLEEFLGLFEELGMAGLEEVYYKYWVHSGASVKLASHGGIDAVITGIDEYGYLRVRSRKDGEELSLQPDGNTFDIMKGLIAMKTNS